MRAARPCGRRRRPSRPSRGSGDDERVAREDLEVARRRGVRRVAAHDGDDREADDALGAEVAERLAGDVVVVVDREPVDAEAGDLVERRQRLGDARAAEQLGERVRLVLAEAEGHLLDVGAVGVVAERDQVAVARSVRDDAALAAVVGDEGVQHAHTGELHSTHISHGSSPGHSGAVVSA